VPRPTDKDKRAEAPEEAGPEAKAETPGSAVEADESAEPDAAVADAGTPRAGDDPDAQPKSDTTAPETATKAEETADAPDMTGDAATATDKADRPDGMPEAEEPREPETPVTAASTPAPEPRRGGARGALLGGAVGAVLGAGAAILAIGGGMVPLPPDPAVPALQSDLAETTTTANRASGDLAALRGDLSALSDRLAAIEGRAVPAPVDLAPVTEGLDALSGEVAKMDARLAEMDARLTELEKRPAEGGAASASALEAFGREMQDLRAEVAQARADSDAAEDRIAALVAEAEAQIAAREAEAEAQATAAAEQAAEMRARAARAAVEAALANGRPIRPALAEAEAAGLDLPPELAGIAEPPTQAELEEEYAPAARRALAAALKDAAGDTFGDRALAFLRTQTGARSLEPRAGDDPDAVLSRAEAALRAGDLDAALAELDGLPEAAQAEMSDWVQRAEARRAAVEAVAALTAAQD